MSERPPKFICELCGGTHPTTEHETAAQPKEIAEVKENEKEAFLIALNERVGAITGDLESRGWEKTAELVGHDEQYDVFSPTHSEATRSYPVFFFRRECWEIEKTNYDPKRGHLIFDIRYHPSVEERRRGGYPRWSGRIELQRIDDQDHTSVYLRESSEQAVGFHFTDKNFDRVSRYYNPSASAHAGELKEHSKNYKSFNWNQHLFERDLPPVNAGTA